MKFMHRCKLFSFLVLLVFLTLSIFSTSISAADKICASTSKGQTLYTQFSLFYEEGHHYTTNYRKGTLVPVNTQIKFVRKDSKNIVVTLPDGQELTIINIKNFSGENIDGIFTRIFSINPIDLSKFTSEEKQAIQSGTVTVGMRKSAVIAALGYPPKHKTPNLQLDQWRYWQNRFGTFLVIFENDKVSQIID